MKLLFTWLCVCLPVMISARTLSHRDPYQAGYLYYDALMLADDHVDDDVKTGILAAYKVDKLHIADNRYLAPFYTDLAPSRNEDFRDRSPSLLTDLGNLDVTNIAEGLARFLASRAREELNEAFLKKLENTLDTYPEFKTAFPRTAMILSRIETYAYSSVLQVLKESFEIDMKNLPANLYEITHLTMAACGGEGPGKKTCEQRLKALQDFLDKPAGKLTALGLYAARAGMQAPNPAAFLNTVATADELLAVKADGRYADANAASIVMLGNLLSQSLVSKQEGRLWIDASELKVLLQADHNYQVFKTYIGLLVAKMAMADEKSKISFHMEGQNGVNGMDEILNKNYTRLDNLLQLVQEVHNSLTAASMAVKSLQDANNKLAVPNDQQFFSYYQAFFITVKTLLHNQLLTAWIGMEPQAKLTLFEAYLDPAVDAAYRIQSKQYSSAVYDVLILLNKLSDTNEGATQDLTDLQKQFNKYAPFIAAAAGAQSSEEVKEIIAAYAMPAGGAAVKRNAAFSATINGYVGPYMDLTSSLRYNSRFGLTAPVGVNFSWAWRDTKKGLRQLGIAGAGINLQLFDLGALVNYYLINGDSASPSKDFSVKLANVFAPGANVCANIRGLPLSIAAGGQYMPVLYNYKQVAGATQLRSGSGWRWQVSVLVDIPLITLAARDFKKAAGMVKQ